jgi:uncharacterized circularly permuted ATP-grasp superfamily protein
MMLQTILMSVAFMGVYALLNLVGRYMFTHKQEKHPEKHPESQVIQDIISWFEGEDFYQLSSTEQYIVRALMETGSIVWDNNYRLEAPKKEQPAAANFIPRVVNCLNWYKLSAIEQEILNILFKAGYVKYDEYGNIKEA